MTSILELSRERIITTLLRFCVLFGFIASLAGTPELIRGQYWASLIIGWLLWGVFLGLSIYRTIPHYIRSALFILGAYAFLLTSLQEQESSNQLFLVGLFTSVILVFLLQGNRWGFLSILSTPFLLYQFFNNLAVFDEELFQTELYFWLGSVYTPWIFYIAITVAPILIVLSDLQTAWRLERKTAEILQQESGKLKESALREQLLREELERTLNREIELNSQKSRIIETIFHEFRTPLAIINQSTDLLVTYSQQLSETKKRQHREAIQTQVFYLDHLMQDILVANMNLIEQKVYEHHWLSLKEIGERLANKWRAEEQRVKIIEGGETAVFLQFDSKLYDQILDQLLDNALKFSEPNSEVAVTITFQNGELITAVQDHGIGILEEETDVIFELFRRGSNIEQRRGLGLGLFIADKIAKAMQGQLAIASNKPSDGSTFVLHLPVKSKDAHL